MPKVDLIATKSFGYNTRRLMAGDEFQARNAVDAMILTRVRKVAEAPKAKPAKKVEPAPTVEEVLTAEVVEAPKAEPKAPTPKAGARARKAKAKK
jgi:hypothetical protein